MKKILSLFAFSLLSIAIVGCSSDKDDENEGEQHPLIGTTWEWDEDSIDEDGIGEYFHSSYKFTSETEVIETWTQNISGEEGTKTLTLTYSYNHPNIEIFYYDEEDEEEFSDKGVLKNDTIIFNYGKDEEGNDFIRVYNKKK